MTFPTELPDWEEAHYYHTIQYFNELVRRHGPEIVLEDLKALDLDTFDLLCYTVLQLEQRKGYETKVAALLRKGPDAD